MKHFFYFSIFSLVIVFSFPLIGLAHELIPKELVEYIKENPDATGEEIKVFADRQLPEYSEKFRDGEKLLSIVRNQETGFFDNLFDFIKIGVKHILSGWDHILFVLTLLLVYIGINNVLKLTSIFTIAHSITLILAGTGVLVINPKITEPLIAFSIAYLAIVTVFFDKNKYLGGTYSKPVSVFLFGLFHGLGFAGLLREIQIPDDKFVSSLFSFNIGIEIGQLLIIAIALPFIYLFREKSWYPLFTKIFAIIISVIAMFWVIQRIFLLN